MAEKVKKVEPTRIPVYINPYPEWTGLTVESNKYGPITLPDGSIVTTDEFKEMTKDGSDPKATQIRLEVQLPVPANDDEAKELYNLAIQTLAVKGVVQHCYGERVITPLLADAAEKGEDMQSPEFIALVEKEIREALVYEEKVTKTSQAKEDRKTVQTVYSDLGLSPDATMEELRAKIAELRGNVEG